MQLKKKIWKLDRVAQSLPIKDRTMLTLKDGSITPTFKCMERQLAKMMR